MIANGPTEFRWRSRWWHLTYAGHIDPDVLLRLLLSVSASATLRVNGSSIVHERSDVDAPYDHTHFAWMWETAPNLRGAHLMDADVAGVRDHPHAESRKSLKWMETVFTQYHVGHKTAASGKPVVIAPVAGP